jgi:hypothetical protein
VSGATTIGKWFFFFLFLSIFSFEKKTEQNGRYHHKPITWAVRLGRAGFIRWALIPLKNIVGFPFIYSLKKN